MKRAIFDIAPSHFTGFAPSAFFYKYRKSKTAQFKIYQNKMTAAFYLRKKYENHF